MKVYSSSSTISWQDHTESHVWPNMDKNRKDLRIFLAFTPLYPCRWHPGFPAVYMSELHKPLYGWPRIFILFYFLIWGLCDYSKWPEHPRQVRCLSTTFNSFVYADAQTDNFLCPLRVTSSYTGSDNRILPSDSEVDLIMTVLQEWGSWGGGSKSFPPSGDFSITVSYLSSFWNLLFFCALVMERARQD